MTAENNDAKVGAQTMMRVDVAQHRTDNFSLLLALP